MNASAGPKIRNENRTSFENAVGMRDMAQNLCDVAAARLRAHSHCAHAAIASPLDDRTSAFSKNADAQLGGLSRRAILLLKI
jgi:hypothetical protein